MINFVYRLIDLTGFCAYIHYHTLSTTTGGMQKNKKWLMINDLWAQRKRKGTNDRDNIHT